MFSGKQIRDKRKSLGLSAEKLSKILKVSRENIYKWEGGTLPRNPEEFMRVQSWLGDVPEEPKTKTVKSESNGIDYKEKYYSLLEKYNALLEKNLKS